MCVTVCEKQPAGMFGNGKGLILRLYAQETRRCNMPKNKVPKTSIPESVEQAWREQGEIGAVKASIAKYAKVLDMTDSGRDIKPLVSGMFEAIDRLKALEAHTGNKSKVTPLADILKKASNE